VSKQFGTLKEALMDYIPEAIIDEMLKKMWKDLELPRAYSSETRHLSTVDEISLISFKEEDIRKWEERLDKWLRMS